MGERDQSKGELRRGKIMQALKTQGRITIPEIMELVDCSEATARRDLDELEQTEPVIRTIGGAQFDGFSSGGEASFFEKKHFLWIEKEAIAVRAAALIEEGDIIGLSGGTTTYLIAKEIKLRRNITVVTNAVNIAMELADSEGVQVVLTGGVMRKNSFELCGPLVEKIVGDLNISKMFMGIDGIAAEQGITTYSEQEAQTGKLLMKRSHKTIAVFDHSKVGRISLFGIAPLASLYACVTDAPLESALAACLAEQNVAVFLPDDRANAFFNINRENAPSS